MKNSFLLLFTLLITFPSFGQFTSARACLDKVDDLINDQQYREALGVLNDAIDAMPDSFSLYDTRGTLLDAFGQNEAALRDFTTGLSKTKDSQVQAHFLMNRGGMFYKLRRFENAYKDLEQAIVLDPTNIDAYNNLAVVCDEIGKPEEVILYLEKIVQIDPMYVPGYVNLGFHFQGKKQHKKAVGYFNKAIEIAPKTALAYSNRSYSYLQLGKPKKALEDINQSLKLYSTNSYAYKIRALIYIRQRRVEDACKDLQMAEKLGYTKEYGGEVETLIQEHCP